MILNQGLLIDLIRIDERIDGRYLDQRYDIVYD